MRGDNFRRNKLVKGIKFIRKCNETDRTLEGTHSGKQLSKTPSVQVITSDATGTSSEAVLAALSK